ncbi:MULTISPECIES: hypothetical protein [Pseudomonas syringae group]|uniref:Uncharacterized protein n=1 Tax=Pseudomonas coronafaciens pv. coronafaciens TaxID=235275 RepID=A0AAE6QE47_9PSED|nr:MULTISPECIES: hypothetical protein [Pseudomonas syringae group]MCQ3015523.1 hypothetical protein [Pseudomonas tremae]QGL55972.1 hypothetical protein POR16_06260 [Pseudomonas coronafaciens pv. oryzae str. 1_6]QGT80820.1 hypothetical protein GMO17_06315 [Pseudomonas coronafaciens pv. coronafaciens]
MLNIIVLLQATTNLEELSQYCSVGMIRPFIQGKLLDIGYIFGETDDMCVNNAAVIFVTGNAGRGDRLASKSGGLRVDSK